MLNLSEFTRTSRDLSLKARIIEYVDVEIYKAESIADYEKDRLIITPPWFKRNPWLSSNYYAIVVFHNIGIDGVYYKNKLTEGFEEVHDESGSKVMSWTKPGKILPAKKSYFQTLEDGDLKVQDWVYRLMIRHSYEKGLPYIAEFTKNEFTHRKREKDSLVNRIASLLPNLNPALQPSY